MDSYLEQTLILQAQHLAAADTLQALAIDASGYLTGNAAAERGRESLNLNVFCAGATHSPRHVRFSDLS